MKEYCLEPVAEALGEREVDHVTTEDLEAFLMAQAQGRSPKTLEHFHTALTTLFNWAVERQYITGNPMKVVHSPRRKRRRKVPDIFSDAEIRALLGACQTRRDRAILLTLLDTGVRRNELVYMDVADLDLKEGFILVCGKGGKDRYVPIGDTTTTALREMLQQHPGSGPLFVNRYGKRLAPYGLRSLLLRLKERAGLECKVHAHKFRHTFARNYLKKGDLESLREILGHEDIKMTATIYGTFLRGSLKEKHRRCSPADNGRWAQQELGFDL